MNKIFTQHCRVTKWCGPKCVNNREVVTSRCHGHNISWSQQTVVLQIWQKKENEKMDRYEFPVLDSTDSPYFSSTVRQCKWPSVSGNIVEIQKFCYHGNMTSHLSLCKPFSAIHSRGTKPPCWKAINALAQAKQKAYIVNMVISFVHLLPRSLLLNRMAVLNHENDQLLKA